MSATLGLVTDTVAFSAVDGPGNRFVVFLQGCNFDCIACHNPFTINVCDGCGACLPVCPAGALTQGASGAVVWDPSVCSGSDRCLAACPRDSTPKARWLSVAELLGPIRRAAPFLSGITVSGGEATRQATFVRELFAAVKADEALRALTCLVDSNGAADRATWDLLHDVMDGAMIDLKCLDPAIHQEMTGQRNDQVLTSILYLHAAARLHEVRLLLLPGVNDAPDLLRRTGRWLAALDPDLAVKVIGFRPHGVRPSARPLRRPTDAEMEAYDAILAGAGLTHRVLV